MLVDPETMTTAAASHAVSTSGEDVDTREEQIKTALLSRRSELIGERAEVLEDLEVSGIPDGGDAADLGTKAFVREQEMVLVGAIQARLDQIDRALGRLAIGKYGWCERCQQEIPVARLAAFPSVTQCVSCKRLEERR